MLQRLQRWWKSRSDTGAGEAGERLAADWLQRERRFRVLARNWRNPKDRREEIDLICEDRDILVFVEVKARAADSLVPGYFAVNIRKRRVLKKAIRSYLAQLRQKPRTFRFDVVEVGLPRQPGTAPAILHFENVELFSKYYRG